MLRGAIWILYKLLSHACIISIILYPPDEKPVRLLFYIQYFFYSLKKVGLIAAGMVDFEKVWKYYADF